MTSALALRDVSKAFRVFHERNQTLKAVFLKGRRVKFDQFWALRNVSFEVPAGSTFGILGSNGSGKSTTLKLLARILEPDGGEVVIRGRTSALLELGAGFHPELSGRENVFLNGAILGLGRKTLASRMDAIVGFAGLEAFIDNPVKTYSSGMYARLGFSIAINVDPEILLLDEVLSVGDEAFQRRCSEKIAAMRTEGRTVLIVSHSLGQLKELCDQAAWIDHGHLRVLGPVNEVTSAYLDEVRAAAARESTGGTGEVRLRSATVNGLPGEARVSADDPVELAFVLEAQRKVACRLRVNICRDDLLVLASFAVDAPGDGWADQACVALHIDRLPLATATYRIRTVIETPDGHAVDEAREVGRVHLATPDGEPGAVRSTGVLRARGVWTTGDRPSAT